MISYSPQPEQLFLIGWLRQELTVVEAQLVEEVETMMRSGREEILGEKVEVFEVLRCPSQVCR